MRRTRIRKRQKLVVRDSFTNSKSLILHTLYKFIRNKIDEVEMNSCKTLPNFAAFHGAFVSGEHVLADVGICGDKLFLILLTTLSLNGQFFCSFSLQVLVYVLKTSIYRYTIIIIYFNDVIYLYKNIT